MEQALSISRDIDDHQRNWYRKALAAIVSLTVSFLILYAGAGCDALFDSGNDFVYTPEDSLEAREIALWLAEGLQAREYVVARQRNLMKQLRSTYGERIPAVKRRFMLPWQKGVLAVKFTQEAAKAINEGSYRWPARDPMLRPDTILKYPDKLGWALLGFKENLNPWRLATRYNALPGVIVSEANMYNFSGFGDYPIKLHTLGNDAQGYLFTSGSTLGPYHYFTSTQGRIRHVGSWDRQEKEEPPEWWLKIQSDIRNFACRGAPEDALCWYDD